MAQIKITQTRSLCGQTKIQRATLKALGLQKISKSVVKDSNACILGMVEKVRHLVIVENI